LEDIQKIFSRNMGKDGKITSELWDARSQNHGILERIVNILFQIEKKAKKVKKTKETKRQA